MYDTNPAASDELALSVGDLVTTYSITSDGWANGTLWSTGESGLFPASYVRPATDADVRSWEDKQQSPEEKERARSKGAAAWKVIAQYLRSKDAEQLAVRAGVGQIVPRVNETATSAHTGMRVRPRSASCAPPPRAAPGVVGHRP